jgi:hypothetical protein
MVASLLESGHCSALALNASAMYLPKIYRQAMVPNLSRGTRLGGFA